MIRHSDRSTRHGAVGLLLAGAMCLLPFLVPYHQLPLLSFYPEWLAAALGLVAFVAVLSAPRSIVIAPPAPSRWLIGFALFLAVCAVARDPAYPQMSLWAVVYVLYAALMIWVGACLVDATGLEKTADVLAACILAGVLANAAAGVIQFYGRAVWLEDFVADLHGIRAYGNIAQSNLYANYLALGQAALLFLWVRRRAGGILTGCAAALLAWATALSDSRAALLYVLWFASFSAVSARWRREGGGAGDMARLRTATLAMAAALIAAYVAVPWFNRALGLGPAGTGDHVLNPLGDIRWQAWMLALRLFAGAPVAGVGIGEFAGAAFEEGLPRDMSDRYEVWTSPHNQVLQLLAETGALGALLVLAAVGTWCWRAWMVHRAAPRAATWWIIAAAGVELIHSLLEFPLWSAHFLGVTALLMGTMAGDPARSPGAGRWGAVASRLVGAAACVGLAGVLALGLRDYWRLDLTRATGAGRTLAGAAVTQDVRTLRELGHGLLAPMAEFWLCVGAPLNRDELALKLAWSERVMRYFPANAIVGRRAIFLALDGRADEAARLIDRLAQPSSGSRQRSATLLRLTEEADQAAIAPLLAKMTAERQGPDRQQGTN